MTPNHPRTRDAEPPAHPRTLDAALPQPYVPRVREDRGVSDVRHVLVLPDRDSAEEAAAELVGRFGARQEPRPVRDALAGEDDAEDAQWLLVLTDEDGRFEAAELESFAAEWEGWREEP